MSERARLQLGRRLGGRKRNLTGGGVTAGSPENETGGTPDTAPGPATTPAPASEDGPQTPYRTGEEQTEPQQQQQQQQPRGQETDAELAAADRSTAQSAGTNAESHEGQAGAGFNGDETNAAGNPAKVAAGTRAVASAGEIAPVDRRDGGVWKEPRLGRGARRTRAGYDYPENVLAERMARLLSQRCSAGARFAYNKMSR